MAVVAVILVFLPFSYKHLGYNSKMCARARKSFRKKCGITATTATTAPHELLLCSLSFRAACCCASAESTSLA